MVFKNILLEQPEAGIYLLTVNRPKALNALDAATLDEIAMAVMTVAGDAAARVLLVTGAGEKAFVAGADISGMQDMSLEQDVLKNHKLTANPDRITNRAERGPGARAALRGTNNSRRSPGG